MRDHSCNTARGGTTARSGRRCSPATSTVDGVWSGEHCTLPTNAETVPNLVCNGYDSGDEVATPTTRAAFTSLDAVDLMEIFAKCSRVARFFETGSWILFDVGTAGS